MFLFSVGLVLNRQQFSVFFFLFVCWPGDYIGRLQVK